MTISGFGSWGIALMALTVLPGCGFSIFSSRETNPIVEDYVGGTLSGNERVGVIGTTASHRIVTVRLRTEGGVGQPGMLCPEPPPDVGQAVASTFAAALQASVEAPEAQTSGSGAAAVASTFASTITPLLRRSQGLQFYRDGMYYLCVAYINGALTAEQFPGEAAALKETAKEMVQKELEKPQPFIPITVVSPDPTKAAEDIIEKLDEVIKKLEPKPD